MEIAIAWYVAGLVGMALFTEFGWRRRGLDVKCSDIVVCAVAALFGGLALIAGILAAAHRLVVDHIDFDRVIFKARR